MKVKHSFVCDDCKIVIQDTDTRESHMCPKCSKAMRWDIQMHFCCNYKRPIHSDSLAIHPSQRAEHQQRFPNIEIDKQNRPVFNNFLDHENYLKKCNLVKIPKKIKPKGKIIA